MKFIGKFAALICAMMFAGNAAIAQTPVPAVVPAVPPPAQPENIWHLDLSTGGRVTIQLRPDAAPAHVERIRTLTRQGFYNGLTFHRVIPGFMAQGGDPTATGAGGSELPDLTAEFSTLPHFRGTVAIAREGDDHNSGNSQFYIMFSTGFSLDRQYTVIGRVTAGMNFVDMLEQGQPPLNPSRILRASIGADNVAPPSPEELRAAAAPRPVPPPGSAPTSVLPPPR